MTLNNGTTLESKSVQSYEATGDLKNPVILSPAIYSYKLVTNFPTGVELNFYVLIANSTGEFLHKVGEGVKPPNVTEQCFHFGGGNVTRMIVFPPDDPSSITMSSSQSTFLAISTSLASTSTHASSAATSSQTTTQSQATSSMAAITSSHQTDTKPTPSQSSPIASPRVLATASTNSQRSHNSSLIMTTYLDRTCSPSTGLLYNLTYDASSTRSSSTLPGLTTLFSIPFGSYILNTSLAAGQQLDWSQALVNNSDACSSYIGSAKNKVGICQVIADGAKAGCSRIWSKGSS